MTHTFKKCYVYMDTIEWLALDADALDLDIEKMKNYAYNNPMPTNTLFKDSDEAIKNFTNMVGTITIEEKESRKFIQWVEELLDAGEL